MSFEINQILACDSSLESDLRGKEKTVVLSSPHFDSDDDRFTGLFVKDYDYRDVKTSQTDSAIQIEINDSGEVSKISFARAEVCDLGLKDVYVEGGIVFIEKSDGTIVRILNANPGPDSIVTISQRILDFSMSPESGIRFQRTLWGRIS